MLGPDYHDPVTTSFSACVYVSKVCYASATKVFFRKEYRGTDFFEEIGLFREKIEGSVKRCQSSLHVCVCQKCVMRRQERKDLEVEDIFEKIGLCEEKMALF